MEKSQGLAVTAVLLLTLFASGCSDVATEADLQKQTYELKDHVSEQVEEGSSPVTKYRLREIEVTATCRSPREEHRFPENLTFLHPEIFEREEGIQTFNGGKTIVRNGISEIDSYLRCPDSQELHDISVDTVEFNESVYSNGALVASENETCGLYAHVVAEDNGYRVEEELREVAHDIYSECLLVKSDIEFGEGENW